MTIFDVVSNIIINLFSNRIYDGKATLCEKISLWSFRKKLLKWTRQYIVNHDGTVLTTGDFEFFLQHHHLIENIYEQITDTDSEISKETFIREQISLFHSIQRHTEKDNYNTDDILKGFIEHFYDEINSFFVNNLSQNERYMVARSNEGNKQVINAVKTATKENKEGMAGIKKLLQEKIELNDPELVWSIYQRLSFLVLNGRVNEVIQIFPLIEGKSNDLENGIAYLLGLFSEEISFCRDFCMLQESIIDDRIFNHICRTGIYVNLWRNNIDFLSKVSERNPELWHIVQAVINGRKEEFYIIEKSEKEGITYFTYHVENKYPNEQSLVKRICLLDILQQPVYNGADGIKQLIDLPENIIDRVISLDRRISEACNRIEISKEHAKELLDDAYELVSTSERLAKDIECIVYEMLLRSALEVSAEASEKATEIIPNNLHGMKNIDFLLLQIKVNNGTVEFDEVINTCMKYSEYWLFNNYLVEHVETEPLVMKGLIEKYLFIIDLDPSVYLIYVQLVNNIDGQDKATELLADYEEKYGDILEYRIDKLRIKYTDVELDTLVSDHKKGKLKYISTSGLLAFVRLLLRHNKYEDVLEVIKKYETTGNCTTELLWAKAIALCNTKHDIEALSIYTKLFELGNHTEEIIYYILALSCDNRRPVSDTVLLCAEQSNNPQILMAAANIYAIENNVEEATKMNIKAMLRTTDSHSKVFNQYLGIEMLEDHSKEIMVSGVDAGTVARLVDIKEKTERKYAIHSVQLLPHEPYEWENTIHIYKERAITLGLFRKKVGDELLIDSHSFEIMEILPIDTYFFRLSMEKVLENGEAKMLSLPVKEGDWIDTEKFTQIVKETIGDDEKNSAWLNQYKDLSQIPVTFYFSKRFVRVTYFQLVSAVIMDHSIIFRENLQFSELKVGDFIFSYAALVVLYKIGWKFLCKQSKYSISSVLRNVIIEETEEAIRNNNREHVSFMGVNNDQLYFVETAETDKAQYMQEAVEFKIYSEGCIAIDNDSDLYLEEGHHVDIKEVLGIADYDAVIIARSMEKTLVSAEILVSGICGMPEIGVSTVGIADFLANETNSADELLMYVRKMVEYKCTVPFTVNTVYRILDFFENSEENEKKHMIEEWSSILRLPMEDEEYRYVMLAHVQECIKHLRREIDRFTPIEECLLYSWLNYSGKKIVVSISDSGEFVTRIVKDEGIDN